MSENNELPRGWVNSKLEDICTIIMGQSPPSSEYNENAKGLPFFQGKAEFSDLFPEIRKWCTAPTKIAEANDILLSVRAPVGPTNLAPSLCCIGRGLAAIRPAKDIPVRYVLYAIRAFNSNLTQLGTGTTFDAISGDDVRAFEIPLAPFAEQHRIVAAIEQQFTRLDAGIAALRQVRAKLKRYRASVLKAAVEGKLTEAWRAEHPATEPASVLLERILKERRTKWEADLRAKGKDPAKVRYVEPAKPDTANLPVLLEEWCWATMEELASPEPRSIQSGPFGSALLHSEFQESGILAIGIDNVLDGGFSMGSQHRISPKKYEDLRKFTARPLDILITVMATVGRCCVVPADLETAIITKHVYRISANQTAISPYFLMLCFNGGSEVRRQLFGQVQGQTRPGINGEILRRIAIPLPSLSEQKQIIAEVQQWLSVVIDLEAVLEANLKRAERLRQSILREAFAGRLVPQDPNDEPASVLLERIRGERKGRTAGNGRYVSVPEPVKIDAKRVQQEELWEGAGN